MLLWLAVSVLAPFPLKSFGAQTLDRIYAIAQEYLGVVGKERDAAAILLARLLSRTDVKSSGTLGDFVDGIAQSNSSNAYLLGTLATVSHLCKLLDADQVYLYFYKRAKFVDTILAAEPPQDLAGGTVYDRLIVKCLARMGAHFATVEDPDDEDAPAELLERILEKLFDTLANANALIRYSAAKAIAVITTKLPGDFQADIVQMCLAHFKIPETGAEYDAIVSNAWHGHLLLLAELLRHKISLYSEDESPDYDAVGEIISFSLRFEQQKLTRTEGTSIRDAACFVAWSLFRSKGRTAMPHAFIQSVATRLVCTGLFDKEVSIRRAASAALQEGIGRYPDAAICNGLELVQLVDFFNLANIEHAYLDIFPQVYGLGYTQTLDFLLEHGIGNYSVAVRRLSARAIATLLKEQGVGSAVSTLLDKKYRKSHTNYFHGAYYAMAEIVAVCGPASATAEQHKQIVSVLAGISSADILYIGPDLVDVFLHMFWAVATNFSVYDEHSDELHTAFGTLTGVLKHDSALSQAEASADVRNIAQLLSVDIVPADVMDAWVQESRDALQQTAPGPGGSIVSLNTALFLSHVQGLSKATVEDVFYKTAADRRAAFEARRVAIRALGTAVLANRALVAGKYLDVFLSGLANFTRRPAKGDVGWVVRRDCVDICGRLCFGGEKGMPEAFVRALVRMLLRLAVEIRTDLRLQAVAVLARVAQPWPALGAFFARVCAAEQGFTTDEALFEYLGAHRAELVRDVFGAEAEPPLAADLLKGLVCTAGAQFAAVHTLAAAFAALTAVLGTETGLWTTVAGFVDIARYGDRVSLAALRFFARALDAGGAGMPSGVEFARYLYDGVHAAQDKIGAASSARLVRVPACVTVYAGVAARGDARGVARLVELCADARSGAVRRRAGDALYELLALRDGEEDEEEEGLWTARVGEEEAEEFEALLGQIDW